MECRTKSNLLKLLQIANFDINNSLLYIFIDIKYKIETSEKMSVKEKDVDCLYKRRKWGAGRAAAPQVG